MEPSPRAAGYQQRPPLGRPTPSLRMVMTANPDATAESVRAALAGRYDLERLLKRGGHGLVFLARELRLDRPVAIKVLSPARAADPDGRARFLREARIAAQLMHPHIVPLLSVQEAAGSIVYATAYVEGETVGERGRRDGPLARADAVRVRLPVPR